MALPAIAFPLALRITKYAMRHGMKLAKEKFGPDMMKAYRRFMTGKEGAAVRTQARTSVTKPRATVQPKTSPVGKPPARTATSTGSRGNARGQGATANRSPQTSSGGKVSNRTATANRRAGAGGRALLASAGTEKIREAGADSTRKPRNPGPRSGTGGLEKVKRKPATKATPSTKSKPKNPGPRSGTGGLEKVKRKPANPGPRKGDAGSQKAKRENFVLDKDGNIIRSGRTGKKVRRGKR